MNTLTRQVRMRAPGGGNWVIGDRRKRGNRVVVVDTTRTRASVLIGSLVALLLVSLGVLVVT